MKGKARTGHRGRKAWNRKQARMANDLDKLGWSCSDSHWRDGRASAISITTDGREIEIWRFPDGRATIQISDGPWCEGRYGRMTPHQAELMAFRDDVRDKPEEIRRIGELV